MDTSGFVEGPPAGVRTKRIYWPELSLFKHGYIEALFVELNRRRVRATNLGLDPYGFSDLAPETLEAILKDCADLSEVYGDTIAGGALFWADRQRGSFQGLNPHTRFPPQTPTIRDDGKVYLTAREGA